MSELYNHLRDVLETGVVTGCAYYERGQCGIVARAEMCERGSNMGLSDERMSIEDIRALAANRTGSATDAVLLVALRDLLAAYDARMRITQCAYCGEQFPLDDEAATLADAHIRTCPEHPMRQVERDRDRMDSENTRNRVRAERAEAECGRLGSEVKRLKRMTGLCGKCREVHPAGTCRGPYAQMIVECGGFRELSHD